MQHICASAVSLMQLGRQSTLAGSATPCGKYEQSSGIDFGWKGEGDDWDCDLWHVKDKFTDDVSWLHASFDCSIICLLSFVSAFVFVLFLFLFCGAASAKALVRPRPATSLAIDVHVTCTNMG